MFDDPLPMHTLPPRKMNMKQHFEIPAPQHLQHLSTNTTLTCTGIAVNILHLHLSTNLTWAA